MGEGEDKLFTKETCKKDVQRILFLNINMQSYSELLPRMVYFDSITLADTDGVSAALP